MADPPIATLKPSFVEEESKASASGGNFSLFAKKPLGNDSVLWNNSGTKNQKTVSGSSLHASKSSNESIGDLKQIRSRAMRMVPQASKPKPQPAPARTGTTSTASYAAGGGSRTIATSQ